MPSPTISESARSIGNSFNNLFGFVKPIRKAVSGLIDPETAYADRWYEQGTTGRPAAAGLEGDPTGRYVPGRMQTDNYNAWRGGGDRTPSAPVLPGYQGRAPITSPNTTFQNADDEYNRLKAQFGGTTGVSQLAGMTSLPTGFTPTGGKQAAGLKDYYAAQQEVGERNIGEIIGGLEYQKGSPMEQWAKANPMLAMREYNKKFPAGEATQGPSDDAIRAAISGGKFYPSEGSPSPITNPPDFGTPANAVPAPPMQQGRAVSAPYDEAQRQAAEKTAGATGMWNFQTTPESQDPGMNFLDAFQKNPQFNAYMLGAGARLGDYFQGIGR